MKHWLQSTFLTGVNLLQEFLDSMNIHVTQLDELNQSELLEQIVAKCFIVADKDRSGHISEDEFLVWCQRQPAIMELLTTQHM